MIEKLQPWKANVFEYPGQTHDGNLIPNFCLLAWIGRELKLLYVVDGNVSLGKCGCPTIEKIESRSAGLRAIAKLRWTSLTSNGRHVKRCSWKLARSSTLRVSMTAKEKLVHSAATARKAGNHLLGSVGIPSLVSRFADTPAAVAMKPIVSWPVPGSFVEARSGPRQAARSVRVVAHEETRIQTYWNCAISFARTSTSAVNKRSKPSPITRSFFVTHDGN